MVLYALWLVDELGTCRAGLVSSEQSVLSVPVWSIVMTVCSVTWHALLCMAVSMALQLVLLRAGLNRGQLKRILSFFSDAERQSFPLGPPLGWLNCRSGNRLACGFVL